MNKINKNTRQGEERDLSVNGVWSPTRQDLSEVGAACRHVFGWIVSPLGNGWRSEAVRRTGNI